MTILRVWDDAGVQHYLDLYDNDPVKLNYNFSDIQDIGKIQSNFSRSFRVPATDTNIALFGNWFNVNLEGTFNPKQKYQADLSWLTLPQMSGHIKLNAVYTSMGKYSDFDIVFFGETATIAKDVGDQKLWDMDLSDLDHELTYENIIDSINSEITGLPAGVVRYALIDKGQNFSEIGGAGTRPLSSDDEPLYAGDFTPMVQVKWLFAKILSDNGFTYTSNFLDNDIDNVFLLFYNGLGAPSLDVLPQENNFNVGVTSDQNITVDQNYEIHAIGGQSESSPFFDGNGNYTIGSPSFFTAPYYGLFSFDVWLTVTNGSGNEDVYFRPVIYDINTGLVVGGPAAYDIANDGFTENYSWNGFTITLTEGQEVALGFQNAFATGSTVVTIESSAAPDQNNGSGWKLYASQSLAGSTVNMTLNAPDYKQIDFIRDLTKLYNLVFVPATDDPTRLLIEPFIPWIGSGSTLDWTEKIDIEKDVVIRPTTDIQARDLELTYKQDGDVLNKAVQEIGFRTYGRMLIDNAENDFATGNQKIELFASPTPCNAVQGTNVIIPKLIDATGTRVKANPRILFWAKELTSTNIKFLDDATDTVQTINYYPYAGHYATPNATVQTQDLNFGPETPFHNTIATPYLTAFNMYWRGYIDSIYSQYARVMSANFNLTSADVLTLQFNEKIYIKDSYWRINKITDYGVGVEALTRVELIKILDINVDPLYVPDTPNDDGSIEFVDWGGALSAGTQAACEQFGYVWDGAKCFSKKPLNIYDPQGSSNKSGQGNASGMSGVFPKVNVSPGVNQYSIIGQGHDIQGTSSFGTVHGFGHEVATKIQSHVFGKYGLSNWEGLHVGGGWWHECGQAEEKGRAQYGVIVMMAEGDLASMSDEIELFIEGVEDYRLVLPDDSAWLVDIDIVFYDMNPATSNLVGQQSMKYVLCLSKTGGVASSTGTISTTLTEIGSYNGKIVLSIDTATDTTQHRLSLVAATGSGNPVYPVKATASIKYTMVKGTCQYSS